MFENNKIFILGMARSGYEAAKFLSKRGNTIVLNDGGSEDKQDASKVQELKDLGVELVFDSHPDDLFTDEFDYLIKNPGISDTHKYIVKAEEYNIPVLNEAELAYRFLPSDVTLVGITGTNGKTTTTTLTYEMVKQSGKRVHLAGNIGYPLISFLEKLEKDDIIVMEVSCQQLANFKEFRPNIALMTNLSVAHLDFLHTYENYKNVKAKLFQNQTSSDVAILNIDEEEVLEKTKNIASKVKYFSSTREISGAYFKDNALYYYDEKIIDRDKFLLNGNHNISNALGSIMIAKELGVSSDDIREVLSTFKGVPHRLEYVDTVEGVSFYNDTKATNIKCTQIALSSFDKQVILILGGMERQQNFHDLDNYLKPVKSIIGIADCRERVLEFAKDNNIPCQIFETLKEAMEYIKTIMADGDTVLLSPASASWWQYQKFEDRGDEFKLIVGEMKKVED